MADNTDRRGNSVTIHHRGYTLFTQPPVQEDVQLIIRLQEAVQKHEKEGRPLSGDMA